MKVWGRLRGWGQAQPQHLGGHMEMEGAPQHLGVSGGGGGAAVWSPLSPSLQAGENGKVTARRGKERKSKRLRSRQETKIVLGSRGGR